MRQKISFRVPNKKRGGFHKSALKKKRISASDKRPAFQFKSVTFDNFFSVFFFFLADPLPPPPSHPVSARSYNMGRGFQQWSLELARGWVEG